MTQTVLDKIIKEDQGILFEVFTGQVNRTEQDRKHKLKCIVYPHTYIHGCIMYVVEYTLRHTCCWELAGCQQELLCSSPSECLVLLISTGDAPQSLFTLYFHGPLWVSLRFFHFTSWRRPFCQGPQQTALQTRGEVARLGLLWELSC